MDGLWDKLRREYCVSFLRSIPKSKDLHYLRVCCLVAKEFWKLQNHANPYEYLEQNRPKNLSHEVCEQMKFEYIKNESNGYFDFDELIWDKRKLYFISEEFSNRLIIARNRLYVNPEFNPIAPLFGEFETFKLMVYPENLIDFDKIELRIPKSEKVYGDSKTGSILERTFEEIFQR